MKINAKSNNFQTMIKICHCLAHNAYMMARNQYRSHAAAKAAYVVTLDRELNRNVD